MIREHCVMRHNQYCQKRPQVPERRIEDLCAAASPGRPGIRNRSAEFRRAPHRLFSLRSLLSFSSWFSVAAALCIGESYLTVRMKQLANGSDAAQNGIGSEGFHTVVVTAARLQADAVMQCQHILAVHQRLKLADARHVHDDRAVDPEKQVRIERLLERAHGNVQQMPRLAGIELNIVLSRFHPVDIRHVNKYGFAGRPTAMRFTCRPGAEMFSRSDKMRRLASSGCLALRWFLRAMQRLRESLLGNRFQQIVDRR